MAEDKILLILPGMRCGVGGGNNGSMGRAGLNVGDVHFAFEILLSKLLSLTLMGKKNESKKYFASLQLDIMKNKIPLLDMTWSVKDINTFYQSCSESQRRRIPSSLHWPSRNLTVP